MSDSAFWRKLAKKFLALPRECAILCARRYMPEGGPAEPWAIDGDFDKRAEFEALAAKGGSRLAKTPTRNLLHFWVDAVCKAVRDTNDTNLSGQEIIGENPPTRSITYLRYNLPKRSATYCRLLETNAIQYEFDESVEQGQEETLAPIANEVPLAEQIQSLRIESKWTIETLAKRTGFDEKTVKRHLSGRVIPRLGNIAIYEQAFSKALRREILIKQMPPKRPSNAP